MRFTPNPECVPLGPGVPLAEVQSEKIQDLREGGLVGKQASFERRQVAMEIRVAWSAAYAPDDSKQVETISGWIQSLDP